MTHRKGGDDCESRKPSTEERLCSLEGKVKDHKEDIEHLKHKGAKMADEVTRLQQNLDRLTAAAAAREARDVAQDAVTAQNVTVLNERIAVLEAAQGTGGLSPELAAAIESTISGMQAVATSLDAADPTPPVVNPPTEGGGQPQSAAGRRRF